MADYEREIDLIDLLDNLSSKWYRILLVAILFAIASFAITTYLIQPKYEAMTTMIVGNRSELDRDGKNLEYNEILTNQKLVETYSEIIKSRSIAEQVISNLELDMEVEDFFKKLRVESIRDTEVFTVTVRDTIPDRARDIANETAEIFRDSIEDIMRVDNVQILDPAISPDEPSSPQVIKLTILAFIAGAFLMALIYSISYILDDTLKNPAQAQELGITVLGAIPRAGKGNVISYDKKQ